MSGLRAPITASAVPVGGAALRHAGGARGADAAARGQGTTEADVRPILLVEADPARRMRRRDALVKAGFPVEAVRNATLARQALAPHRRLPALMIADTDASVCEGFALSEALRCDQRTAEVPVLLLATAPSDGEVLRSREVGADDLVSGAMESDALLALARLETGVRHADGRRMVQGGALAIAPLLRGLLAGHRAGTLLLELEGQLTFSAGRVVDAGLGGLRGADAARSLLRAEARVQGVHIGPALASTGLALSATALGLVDAHHRAPLRRLARVAPLPAAVVIPFGRSPSLSP